MYPGRRSAVKEMIKEGKSPLDYQQFHFTEFPEESRAINETAGPELIISASGMCDAGRIVHHLRHHIWQENTHILFVGYQAIGTLGRRLIDGVKKVKIRGEEYQVQAKNHTIGGLSAHADVDDMLSWLNFYKECDPELFLVHGDPDATERFASRISRELGLKTHIPAWHDTFAVKFLEGGIRITLNKGETPSVLVAQQRRWEKLSAVLGGYLLEKFRLLGEETTVSRVAGTMLENMNDDMELLLETLKSDSGEE